MNKKIKTNYNIMGIELLSLYIDRFSYYGVLNLLGEKYPHILKSLVKEINKQLPEFYSSYIQGGEAKMPEDYSLEKLVVDYIIEYWGGDET